MKMLEIKYRTDDEEDLLFLTNEKWMWDDPGAIAKAIAENDREQCGCELYDTDSWPRDYEIKMNGKWVRVSVNMEYSPNFSATVNTEDDRARHSR